MILCRTANKADIVLRIIQILQQHVVEDQIRSVLQQNCAHFHLRDRAKVQKSLSGLTYFPLIL